MPSYSLNYILKITRNFLPPEVPHFGRGTLIHPEHCSYSPIGSLQMLPCCQKLANRRSPNWSFGGWSKSVKVKQKQFYKSYKLVIFSYQLLPIPWVSSPLNLFARPTRKERLPFTCVGLLAALLDSNLFLTKILMEVRLLFGYFGNCKYTEL